MCVLYVCANPDLELLHISVISLGQCSEHTRHHQFCSVLGMGDSYTRMHARTYTRTEKYRKPIRGDINITFEYGFAK